ncbi:MAG: hypothetical protein H6730_35215 [Deltaproteobacteria bacterium]|nr:hypothetical protein [Deltaproteobacteria bacterium]
MAALFPRPCEGPSSDEEVDLFGDYRQLFPIHVLGRLFWVPEDNTVLRALQFLELREGAVRLPYKDYCWNDTKGCCEMRYRPTPEAEVVPARACQTRVAPGLEVVALPKGGRACW